MGVVTEQAPVGIAARATARVLVVDDEPGTRRLLAFNLERADYRPHCVETGEDALVAIDADPPDLVLLDLMLPGIDGIETLRRLRRRHPELPVIVLTAHGSVENAVEAMKLGARDFLTKPIDAGRLTVAVRNALDFQHLARELSDLRQRLGAGGFSEIVGADGGLRETMRMVEKVLPTDLTVLLLGESGTGKDLFARTIHEKGPRAGGPFVAINCAALPEALLESELFGHERGSFTGAVRTRAGKFEAAHGGTLFLDEIGEMSPALQVKLLRAIQEQTITRLGGAFPIAVDVRIICATNRDLGALVLEGRFREDLFYRVSVFPVTIPPLRERRQDIPHLVRHVLERACGGRTPAVHPSAMALLEAYDWPGNVREMQNCLHRALVLAGSEAIQPEHLPEEIQSAGLFGPRSARACAAEAGGSADGALPTLEEVERRHILRAVEFYGGNLSQVSRALGIGRTTLYRKLQRYGSA